MGIWKLLLLVIAIFILFGAGKLPRVLGDLGVGIRKFKDGLNEGGDIKDVTPKEPK
ncbi:MAG: twin-arginine translocase TatA/TatE family subunit [Alphaproteobacteria bacterium]|nr:twin-arginine translocase TatA/TatE family subunit [Alphaproteobacteria bacterium]